MSVIESEWARFNASILNGQGDATMRKVFASGVMAGYCHTMLAAQSDDTNALSELGAEMEQTADDYRSLHRPGSSN